MSLDEHRGSHAHYVDATYILVINDDYYSRVLPH